jgi:hypothetical protein
MFARRCVQGFLLLCLSAAVLGCASSGLDSIQVTPAVQSLSVGQTAQFSAVGTYGNAKHATTNNITTGVNWTSSAPSVATVSASGVATAVSPGTTTITAGGTAFNGATSASATLTVTGTTGGSAGTLLSVNIIPSSITVGNLQDTGNFLAFGTFSSAPFVRDLTNSVAWVSSAPDVFPVNSNNSTAEPVGATAGVVTAYGSGIATITAEATGSNGSIETATATFGCPLVLPNPPNTPGSCFPGSQVPPLKATITVYNEGLNTTNWEVTAPSATGTPDVIHCGPGWALGGGTGGSVCAAPYPNGTTVTITAPATGAAFGGWSYNCAPTAPITAAGPNSCTVTLSSTNPNVTVGAIFN